MPFGALKTIPPLKRGMKRFIMRVQYEYPKHDKLWFDHGDIINAAVIWNARGYCVYNTDHFTVDMTINESNGQMQAFMQWIMHAVAGKLGIAYQDTKDLLLEINEDEMEWEFEEFVEVNNC